jgi:hypothetical protein
MRLTAKVQRLRNVKTFTVWLMLTKRSLTTAGNLAVLIERITFLWFSPEVGTWLARVSLASHTNFTD